MSLRKALRHLTKPAATNPSVAATVKFDRDPKYFHELPANSDWFYVAATDFLITSDNRLYVDKSAYLNKNAYAADKYIPVKHENGTVIVRKTSAINAITIHSNIPSAQGTNTILYGQYTYRPVRRLDEPTT